MLSFRTFPKAVVRFALKNRFAFGFEESLCKAPLTLLLAYNVLVRDADRFGQKLVLGHNVGRLWRSGLALCFFGFPAIQGTSL